MSARILVVDDVVANVTLLKAKLQAAFYTVLTATSGAEALAVAARERPDLILLDVMMPEMDGYEVCRRLKATPELSHIPVVMVTALDQRSDRLRGLEAGADDFLTKPPNDMALFARVRNRVRFKLMIEELRLRNETMREVNPQNCPCQRIEQNIGRIVIGEARPTRAEAIADALRTKFGAECVIAGDGGAVLATAASDPAPELFIISCNLAADAGDSLCAELRARPATRRAAIIVVAETDDYASVSRALDLGANDYLMRPIDEAELIARTRAQIARERYTARLRAEADANYEMALRDPLTSLYNRRYADQHLRRVLSRNARDGAPAAALLLDLDRFKSINDTYGHGAGDEVLVEFSRRFERSLRAIDLCARYGGEEFLALLPETYDAEAVDVANRIRAEIADAPFKVSGHGEISVTVSIGVATGRGFPEQNQEPAVFDLLSRADEALYVSKANGRNRVSLASPPPSPAPPPSTAAAAGA